VVGQVLVAWRIRVSSGHNFSCEIAHLQRASCSHPSEVLVEKVTFGVFTEGERFERGGVFSPVVVLRDVRDHGDGGCRLADELVRE
jgi:hypothetical protein